MEQIGKALWTDEKVAHDENRPPLAEDLEGPREATELPIDPNSHPLVIAYLLKKNLLAFYKDSRYNPRSGLDGLPSSKHPY